MDLVNRIRAVFKDAAITTDIMVGFAGEDDREFTESLNFVKQVGFARAHIFAYSKREGTPAAVMDGQVPAKIASERVNKLYSVVEDRSEELLKPLNGTVTTVIPESYKEGVAHGHTASFVEVAVACNEEVYSEIQGKLVPVKLSVCKNTVTGELQ